MEIDESTVIELIIQAGEARSCSMEALRQRGSKTGRRRTYAQCRNRGGL